MLLVVPACEPGRGGGHLVRCLALVRDLRALGREARLFPGEEKGEALSGVLNAQGFDRAALITQAELGDRACEWIILDRFQTPPEEYERWAKKAPLIGIDEGGPCRDRFDFLIDILPGLPDRSQANIKNPSLLPLAEKDKLGVKSAAFRPGALKVLVSFGQEDSAGLGPVAAHSLAAKNSGGSLDVTLLSGLLHEKGGQAPVLPQGVRVLESLPRLGERLACYDLLVTHYGITAFEALYAGTPVILVSPTACHEKLAKAGGFCSAGTGVKRAARISCLLFKEGRINGAFLQKLKDSSAALAARYNLDSTLGRNLGELINGFTPLVKRRCPVCGAEDFGPALFRDTQRTYRSCKKCGVICMNRLNPPPVEYEKEYFFESYQKQYGKTYIEDFPNLIAAGKRRLAMLKPLLSAEDGQSRGRRLLLDIGCAYGPFLAAAKEEGFSPAGLDPAEDAVRYVTQTLGIPALRGFFPDCGLPSPAGFSDRSPPLFDAVTLWYVIEHFQDCVPVFAAIRRILKPGGALAFSTPSFSGISGRSSLKRFLDKSPADHRTVWSPDMCKKALAQAGFTVKKIAVSGHHPERFPLLGRFARRKKNALYLLLLALSKAFRLGDTFEVYAVLSSI